MQPAPLPPGHAALALAARLGVILAGLAALIARRFLRDPRFTALIIPLWTRLSRGARRFERAVSRPAIPPSETPGAPRPTRAPVTPRPMLPRAQGWLIRALGHEAVAHAAYLEHLLADPAMAALLTARPHASRILRPFCRMLGLPAVGAPDRPPPPPRIAKPPRAIPARSTPPRATHPHDWPIHASFAPPPTRPLPAPLCPRAAWPWFPNRLRPAPSG